MPSDPIPPAITIWAATDATETSIAWVLFPDADGVRVGVSAIEAHAESLPKEDIHLYEMKAVVELASSLRARFDGTGRIRINLAIDSMISRNVIHNTHSKKENLREYLRILDGLDVEICPTWIGTHFNIADVPSRVINESQQLITDSVLLRATLDSTERLQATYDLLQKVELEV